MEGAWWFAVPALAWSLGCGSAESRHSWKQLLLVVLLVVVFCSVRDKDLKAMLFGAPGEEVLLRVNPGTINHFQNSCYSFLNIPSELAQFISTPGRGTFSS